MEGAKDDIIDAVVEKVLKDDELIGKFAQHFNISPSQFRKEFGEENKLEDIVASLFQEIP